MERFLTPSVLARARPSQSRSKLPPPPWCMCCAVHVLCCCQVTFPSTPHCRRGADGQHCSVSVVHTGMGHVCRQCCIEGSSAGSAWPVQCGTAPTAPTISTLHFVVLYWAVAVPLNYNPASASSVPSPLPLPLPHLLQCRCVHAVAGGGPGQWSPTPILRGGQ